jgi:alpha-L-fucosidase
MNRNWPAVAALLIESGQFHDSETKSYTAEDFRFTTNGDTLYAIEMAWPKNGRR